MKKNNLLLIAIMAIAGYLILAYVKKLWPFTLKPTKKSGASNADNARWLRGQYEYAKHYAPAAGLEEKGSYSKEELQKIQEYLKSQNLELLDPSAFEWLDAIDKQVRSGKFSDVVAYTEWLKNS